MVDEVRSEVSGGGVLGLGETGVLHDFPCVLLERTLESLLAPVFEAVLVLGSELQIFSGHHVVVVVVVVGFISYNSQVLGVYIVVLVYCKLVLIIPD